MSRRRLYTLAAVTTLSAGTYSLYATPFFLQQKPAYNPHIALSEHAFAKWTIVRNERVSSTSHILTVRPPADWSPPHSATHRSSAGESGRNSDQATGPYNELFRKGTWAVQIKQPHLSIAREYTPLPPLPYPSESAGHREGEELSFLIRRDGETSRYITSLPTDATLEMRGPKHEYVYPEHWEGMEEVLFLAGGTGIAPALQVAYALGLAKQGGMKDGAETIGGTRIALLWANRRREDCRGGRDTLLPEGSGRSWASWFGFGAVKTEPDGHSSEVIGNGQIHPIVNRMGSLERSLGPERLEVKYLVDEEGSSIQSAILAKLFSRLPRQSDATGEKSSGGTDGHTGAADDHVTRQRKVVVVSGPAGFVNYFAGPKDFQDGKEVQGPLGGVLGVMKSRGLMEGWEVYKL